MKRPNLPAWAEDVLRRYGPQPAHQAAEPDPIAAARYAAVTARFRRRWHELDDDVWPLFSAEGTLAHVSQAQHLLGLMIDLARAGSPAELAAKRAALDDLGRLEEELRDLAGQVVRKTAERAALMRAHLIEGGLADDIADSIGRAAEALAIQSWAEPRLSQVDISDSINSRKTSADALNLLLRSLERMPQGLHPVALTDRARATIYNVTQDVDTYGAENVKVARKRLRDSR